MFTAILAASTRDLARKTGDMAAKTGEVAAQTRALATETAQLARETVESVKVGRDAIDAEDRRHRDKFMPYVVITAQEEMFQTEPGIIGRWLIVRARNIGARPAVNIWTHHQNAGVHGIFPYPGPPVLATNQDVIFSTASPRCENRFASVQSYIRGRLWSPF